VDVHELTAAYAVDALSPEERERYEAHLARCEACRGELASLAPAATALAYAVDAPPLPPGLRDRIVAAVAADNVVAFAPRRRWPLVAAGAAAAAAAALAIWGVALSQSLSHVRSQRDAAARAVQILGDPRAATHRLSGAAGVVGVDPDGRGVLVIRRLARAPHGKTYEAWVMQKGVAPIPAGTFTGGSGTTVLALAAHVPRGATVGATVERAGGSPRPTTTPFATATT
jgi:anti-sigma factor RsiW